MDDTAQPERPRNLREAVSMLRDKDGWRLVGRWPNDEATYRNTGIYLYLNCDGIAFRKYRDRLLNPAKGNNVIYEPNPFAHVFTTIFTRILRRYLQRGRS